MYSVRFFSLCFFSLLYACRGKKTGYVSGWSWGTVIGMESVTCFCFFLFFCVQAERGRRVYILFINAYIGLAWEARVTLLQCHVVLKRVFVIKFVGVLWN